MLPGIRKPELTALSYSKSIFFNALLEVEEKFVSARKSFTSKLEFVDLDSSVKCLQAAHIMKHIKKHNRALASRILFRCAVKFNSIRKIWNVAITITMLAIKRIVVAIPKYK